MQVVILAGGLGTRLRPLTYKTHKVMVPIRGKPFLEYQLELLKRNNLNNIVLCVDYLGEQIKNYFKNGEKLGINILYSGGKIPLGTGDALKGAKDILKDEFLLLNGDTFLDIDYQDLISYFHKQQKLATIVVFENQPKIMVNNVEIDSKNKVLSYDKRKEGGANCVDSGVQVYKKDIFELFPQKKKISLEEEIFPILIQKEEMTAYLTNQKFYDIGTHERLKNFNQIL